LLCHFANTFPPFTAEFIQRGLKFKRRFREETITDMMMASLAAHGMGRVLVDFPNESVTGADMEWNFVNEDDSTFFRLLIQAKLLSPRGNSWKQHYYKQLLHKTKSSNLYQAEVLVDAANRDIATYPLYAFYNPQITCDLARASDRVVVNGVELADGYFVEQLVKARRPSANRISNIYKEFFPLSALFCPDLLQPFPSGPYAYAPVARTVPVSLSFGSGPPRPGIPFPPRPEDVRDRLRDIAKGYRPDLTSKKAQIPEVSVEIPASIRRRMEMRGLRKPEDSVEFNSNVRRVIFLSSNPKEPVEG
jgi:hypothetical protein